MNNIELLMPAGNIEKMRYAFFYGEYACYLGMVDYSLRTMRKGELITRDNLKIAVDEARRINKKVYLTLNIFAYDDDIKKLYEDKLNGLINNNDFSRMYDKKVKEREESQNKLKELNEIKFEKHTIDYEKVMNDFLEKDNITAYMLNSLIEKIEVDNNKQATIYYKFSDLNKLSKVL